MPISLAPTAGRRDPERVRKILAACGPGKTDADVAAEVGCSVGLVSAVRRANGVPAGVPRGGGDRPESRFRHLPCPPEWVAAAAALGLAALVHDPGLADSPDSWHVSCVRTGRFVGSWVPATGSLRARGTMHAGVTDPAAALALFAGGVPS